MSESKRDLSVMSHILEYCIDIEHSVDRFGDTFECFESDKIYRNAVAMCILQIGELAGKLSSEFTTTHTDIPWRSIKAMRNIAAHAYGSMSVPDIWDTVKHDIPTLKAYCRNILEG
jgi:uncharacterized protein with HEPN domain